MHELPLTTRTLLKTKYNRLIIIKSRTQYHYFGLIKMLIQSLNKNESIYNDTIHLNLNIDSLPIYKSRNIFVWPILFSINIKPFITFPSAFALESKPNNLDFMKNCFILWLTL